MKTNLSISNLDEILHVDQHKTGNEYLCDFAKNIARVLDVKYIIIGQTNEDCNQTIETLVMAVDGKIVPNITYNLKDTPCENAVTGKRVCFHNQNIAKEYPKDTMLVDIGAEAYIGAPIIKPNGELFGLLAILDDKRIEDEASLSTLIEFLASRAGAEIYRAQYEEKLINIKDDLEKQVQKKTVELTNALEQINSQKKLVEMGRISAGVAHEIKNPLNHLSTSILGIQNFMNEYKDNISQKLSAHEYINEDLQEATELLKIATEQTDRINKVVQMLLGQGAFNEKEKHVEGSLKEVISDIFREKASELSDSIGMKIHSDGDATCMMNKVALTHLFSNMTDNAIYALQKKLKNTEFKPVIDVTIQDLIHEYKIIFKDNGVGIPQKIKEDIFKPYFTTKDKEGTGLGLMVAQDIVKAHGGGNIELNSKENEFTEFTFNINKG